MSAASLETDIKAYEAQLEELLKYHEGKYVVFYDGSFVDAFDTFQNAADTAVKKYGLGPYLIRKVRSAQSVRPLPASVVCRPIYVSC